ncbi:hypothetical protein RclHR1_06510009 [Rhizophagus clarus]|uniref:Uncharacterized protein n=1 Tax=Rhizophagus clarus TaxID=94130 RepID=A0A2Z6SA79_9GLOM|nr:hypothetical protein RclHR1_06510009 [Rhizophagus clarus]GES96136.1 hypothetical protein RCL_jg470.t1 [Rhizophagus clarus]
MIRPKKNCINKDHLEVTDDNSKTREFVKCNCLLHCSGSKLMDPRTFKKHQEEVAQFQIIASGSQSSSQIKGIRNKLDHVESSLGKRGKRRIRTVEHSSDDNDDNDSELSLSNSELMSERSGRQNCTSRILDDMILDGDDSDDSLTNEEGSGNRSLIDDDDRSSKASKTFTDDDYDLNENEVLIKQFTAPDFNDLDYESDHRYFNTNINYDDLWILLWIFKYQARFHFSDVTIDSLIKFFKIVLSDAD